MQFKIMKKFKIYSDQLTEKQLFRCILKGSAFAQKRKIKKFYTHNGEPKNWEEELIEDIHESRKTEYKGYTFYVVGGGVGEKNDVVYIFYKNHVYSFDDYYSDCPILKEILRKRKKK